VLLDTLVHLSGPSPLSRLPAVEERLLTETLRRRLASKCFALSYARRAPATPQPGGAAAARERLSLFALTTMEVFEFEVNFEQWVDPYDSVPFFGTGNDKHPSISPEQQREQGPLACPSPNARKQSKAAGARLKSAADSAERAEKELCYQAAEDEEELERVTCWTGLKEKDGAINKRRDAARSHSSKFALDPEQSGSSATPAFGPLAWLGLGWNSQQKQAAALKTWAQVLSERQGAVATLVLKESLTNLKQIEFDGGEESQLRLVFGRESRTAEDLVLDIVFFDDTARECWRRGLGTALSGDSAPADWHRDWTQPSPV